MYTSHDVRSLCTLYCIKACQYAVYSNWRALLWRHSEGRRLWAGLGVTERQVSFCGSSRIRAFEEDGSHWGPGERRDLHQLWLGKLLYVYLHCTWQPWWESMVHVYCTYMYWYAISFGMSFVRNTQQVFLCVIVPVHKDICKIGFDVMSQKQLNREGRGGEGILQACLNTLISFTSGSITSLYV